MSNARGKIQKTMGNHSLKTNSSNYQKKIKEVAMKY